MGPRWQRASVVSLAIGLAACAGAGDSSTGGSGPPPGDSTGAAATSDGSTTGGDGVTSTSGVAGSGSTTDAAADGSTTGAPPTTTGPIADPCAGLLDGTSSACSEASDTEVMYMVTSQCTERALELFWVDYDCNEVSYGVLPPGSSLAGTTFVSHPWRVRDAETGDLLRQIPPAPAGGFDVTIP